jgi:hypothetical protein
VTDLALRTASFPPELMSARHARHLIEEQVSDWGLDALREPAALCGSELAANAILHTREAFTMALRRTGSGARIDVIDRRPDQLPLIVPSSGTADDILRRGLTGRGLQLIAALAVRWGAFTAGAAKSVWAELDVSGAPREPTDGVLEDARVVVEPSRARTICYLGLPVRAAVASGVQLDEAVRRVQLGGATAAARLGSTTIAELLELVDRSAAVRLSGRHAAFLASGEGDERFDLDITADAESFAATSLLAPVLARIAPDLPLSDGVGEFRQWLTDEAERQGRGLSPAACPLPT